MISEKFLVCIIVMIKLLNPGVEGQMVCSCYDFDSSSNFSWQQAKVSCDYYNKTLVVMETEEEWQFIKNKLKQQVSAPHDEWLIGLFKNMTTGNWTWVNGKPLTIDKWQPNKPAQQEKYALIAKEYPPGWPGSFNSIFSNVYRGWICEEESVNCSGEVCWRHIQQPTTTTETLTTNGTSSTTATSRVVTSEGQVPATTTRNNEQKHDENKSPVEVIAAVSVAGFLLILAIVLGTCYFVRRRKLGDKDADLPPSKSNQRSQQPESQYDSINATEAAKLLQPAEDNTYAETRNNVRKKAPKVELAEYVNVDNSGRKQPTADHVYAELAEFDDGSDDTKPPKPAPYEPTVYADVDQPQLRTGSNPEEHTYANFQSSAV